MANIEKYKVEFEQVNNNYYKVYDEKGNYLYNIDCKNEKEITNQYLRGVTCFVINPDGKILIEQRANKGLTPGKLDLVSGHLDGNEVSTQAVIRELKEEVGIGLEESSKVIKLGTLPLSFNSNNKSKNFFIDFYCLFRNKNITTLQKEEVQNIYYLPMDEVFKMINEGKTKFPQRQLGYEEIFRRVEAEYKKRNENTIIKDLIL